MWIEEADIDLLLNDKRSLQGPLNPQDPPKSLLNSQRMYMKLLDALDGMDTPEGATHPVTQERPSLVDTIDLFSTTTDLYGVALPIALADQVVYERRFRNVFHFRRRPALLEPPAPVPPSNDFLMGTNPFLAYAARCTSAFPFAFEPMALCDITEVLNARNLTASLPFCAPDTPGWQHFYKDYLSDPSGTPFQFRPFGDGGYLDNKPFSYAIDTILSRKAALPVDRKLIYIEPAPEDLSKMTFHASGPDDRPDAVQNSLKALIELPRYETIRQDLGRLLKWNANIRRMTRIRSDIRGILKDGGDPAVNLTIGPGEPPVSRLRAAAPLGGDRRAGRPGCPGAGYRPGFGKRRSRPRARGSMAQGEISNT
jgi:patatin-related protein